MGENKLFRFIVILISFGLCLSAGRTIFDLWHRRDLITNRQKDLTKITTENQTLEARLKEIQGGDYVERIARDKLGLVRDGESIILLPDTQNGEVIRRGEESGGPNWQKWWKLFF